MPYYKWIASAVFLLMAGTGYAQVGGGGGTNPLNCTTTNGSVTPNIRAEGLAELVGDIVIVCLGGVTAPSGTTLPQVNITVSLNAAITSRLLDSTNGSEALLIVDEPGSGLQGAPTTQLACATPLTGCPIIANGAEPYDGSPGHPNVFQGVVQGNSVTFNGVPLTAGGNNGIFIPVPAGVRVLRITNLRVNAAGVNAGGVPFTVGASIAMSGGAAPPLDNPTLTVAFGQSGLVYQTHAVGSTDPVNSLDLSNCSPGQYCQVGYLQFQENVATAFKVRLQGAAQNIPGTVYNSESGFYNPGLAASNPNLATAGLADLATRLKADFQGVPAGAQLWVGLNSISNAVTLTTNESGAFAAVAATGSINGIPAARLTVTNGAPSAVWEVNSNSSPARIDTVQIPVWIYFPPGSTPSGTLTINGSFAPNPDDGAFAAGSAGAAQNSTYPIPRFSTGNFSVRHLNPSAAIAGGPSFSLTVGGAQFVSGAAVYWNGAPLTTTFINSNQLTAFVPASLIAVEATASVTVVNPGGITAPALTFTTFTVPAAVSVTPSAGLGSTQTFTFVYSDPDGAGDLASVEALINLSQSAAGGCYVLVTPSTGAITLANDAGVNFSPPRTLGTGGTLQNSECSINVGQSSGVAAGNTYTLSLAVTFESELIGMKIYGDAQDWAGFDSGWQQLGSWSQTTTLSVSTVSVTPSSGSGASQLFTFQFSDTAGAQDFLQTNMLIGSTTAVAGACAVVFNRANGTLALLMDSGAMPASTIPIGSGSQQNSQCILSGSGSSVTIAGATLTLSFSIAFQPGFAGVKNIYASATSLDGSAATQQLGMWTATAVALRFVPLTPCRVADTRQLGGAFGPAIAGGTTRDFRIPDASCGIPFYALAYSLNVAVVPAGPLGFLTLWPSGQSQPLAATLNSLDGRIKSNAAIIPAGEGGIFGPTGSSISVFASNTTDVVLDINGYFVAGNFPTALAFFPVTPCRVADTRVGPAPLGAPSLIGGQSRTFPILSSTCNIPATAQAYSFSLAAVPSGPLGFITAWPTGQGQPVVASLNALTGTVTANAAIVPAGAGGSIDIFASNRTDLVIDINGYFAPMATGGLSFYSVTPCRALDTRSPAGSQPFTGKLDTVIAGNCGIPATAQAYVVNATVVPSSALGFLTLWPQSQSQPTVSTLNALDGAITSNMAIVPTVNGSISAFASNPTHLILDIVGYFAP